jgi:hypothetical protein
MHVVQTYPSGNPSWLVEGIADYVRNKYGINNESAGWHLSQYNPGQNYTDSYRVTAAFLTWLKNTIQLSIIEQLDSYLRQRTYNNNTWQELTGQTVDQLWDQYATDIPSTGIISSSIYKLINVNSGKALDVTQSGTVNGANVQIWNNNNSAAQQWRLQAIDDDSVYKLINVISEKALDVDHSGTDNGTNVHIWTDNGTAAQKWRLIRLS